MIIDYFKHQMDDLNIEKLKSDFQEFYGIMKKLDLEMTNKMTLVDIMYAQVEAGFCRNARDRSDYLVHYDKINGIADVSLIQFRSQLNDCNIKIDKLSTCILSIVNEQEAA